MLAALSSACSFSAPATRAPLSVEFDGAESYSVLLGSEAWLKSGSLRFFVNGEWHGTKTADGVTGTIRPTGNATTPHAGTDGFGAYERVSFEWEATSSKGSTAHFATAVRSYKDGATVVFEQSIASGAQGTNHKNVSFADSARGQRATVEPFPFLQFPSFDLADSPIFAEEGRAGFVTWQGTMVTMHGPKAGPPAAEDLGLSSGPVVIFDGLAHGGRDTGVVVSPATHFKGATMNVWQGATPEWVIGLSGEITAVPAGFSHETVLHAGKGVTSAVAGFGALMRAAHKTEKRPDPVVSKTGYWTDNGAYYYGDAYPQHKPDGTTADYNLTCCTAEKLLAAKAGLDADGLRMAYVQLDDWWYHGPHPVRNFSGAVKCVREWQLPADTYPGGLRGFRAQYGAPLLLYGPYFCEDNEWQQELVPAGADAGVPPPAQSEAFYTRLFEYARAHGGGAYEVDFMSNLFLGVPEFRRTLDAAAEWQRGMNAAALRTNVTIQFCMMQPSDLLQTLSLDAVTNGRASGDYCCDGNWDLGGASLLFWALGMRPSKDNFWSSDGQQKQWGWNQAEDNPGSNGELNAILATMSTGPVGPADGAGQHNATRLRRTCAADGTILQPGRPLVPIDAAYRQALSPAERQLRAGAVWSTWSRPAAGGGGPGGVQHHLLAVDAEAEGGAGASIFASDLGIAPPPGGGTTTVAVRDWHRSAACVDGADAVASGCVRVAAADDAAALVTLDGGMSWPFGTHTTQLYTLTPLQEGGVTLLGELDKFVPLSAQRFHGVASDAAGLRATLHGRPGEVVHVCALKHRGVSLVVVAVDVTIGANGVAPLDIRTIS